MSYSETVSWEKMSVDIDLDSNGEEWTLQINPIDRRDSSYVVSGRIDQFRISSVLAWAKELGYTDLFCAKLESALGSIFEKAELQNA